MIFSQLDTSFRDRLSGLYSEEYFVQVFYREWHRMLRERDALSVVIIHPHLNTNREDDKLAFKLVSESVKRSTKRSTDLVCRFHTNEIAIGLFNLDEEGTEKVLDRIFSDLEDSLENYIYPIDLSIGALNVLPSTDVDLEDVFTRTEKLADAAELEGKNAYKLEYMKIH
ncbi:diguanylate cyclase [Psychrosphaera sp.]|nr:diguanylate cyclase [Psychrosphaera sp.]